MLSLFPLADLSHLGNESPDQSTLWKNIENLKSSGTFFAPEQIIFTSFYRGTQ